MATQFSHADEVRAHNLTLYNSWSGRITILALLVTAALCTMDRMVLSLVVDPVRADLSLSETQMGLLQGLSFSLLYTIVGIPLGLMTDRMHRARLLAFAVFFWSLGTFLCGLAGSFESMFAARMMVGAGEAALWPVAVSLIGDLVPDKKRGSVIGMVIIGQLLGGSFSLIVGGRLLETAMAGGLAGIPFIENFPSWRALFIVYGMAGTISIVMLFLGAEPKRFKNELPPEVAGNDKTGIMTFLRFFLKQWKTVGLLYLLTSVIAAVQYSGAAWNVPILLRRFDYSPKEIGDIMGIMMLVAGAAGAYLGGVAAKFTDNIQKRLTAISICYGICLAYSLLILNPSFEITLFLFGLPAMLIALAGVIKIVIMQDIMPSNMRGIATAVNHIFSSLIGASAGPVIVAALTQYVFKDDKMVGVSLGIVVGGSLLLGIALCLLIKREITKHELVKQQNQ